MALMALILGYNIVKEVLPKFTNELSSKGLGPIRSKKIFPETIIHRVFETIAFM